MGKYGIRVAMDEERMKRDGYDIEKKHALFDRLFVERLKLTKNESRRMYEGDGKHAWSSVWASVDICEEIPWFKEYVTEWKYLTNAYSGNPEVFECEDIIKEYRRMGVM